MLLLSFPLILFSQMNQYQEIIDRSKLTLAYDPLNDTERLTLAYYQMLAGQYEQALPNYQIVISRDSTNVSAAAGLLWALNSLGKYSQTLKEGHSFLKTMPKAGLLYYHQANALFNKGSSLRARTAYLKAIKLIDDTELKQLPAERLVWCYQALNDYPRSKSYLELLDDQALSTPKEVLRKKLYKTNTSFSALAGIKDTTSVFLEADAIIKHRSMSYKLKLEEILVDDAYYRWSALVTVKKQTRHMDISLSALMLKSEDTRAESGNELSLEIRPRIYISDILIRPRIAQHAATFSRFNTYQSDLGLELNIGKTVMSYQGSYLYQDNDSIDSDATRLIHTTDLYYRLNRSLGAGLHAGFGDMAWYTSSSGSITDDFEPSDSYYGVSLSTGLSRTLRLVLYYQYGTRNEETSHLGYIRLSYAS